MGKKYFTLVIFFVFCLLLSCGDAPWDNLEFILLWAVAVDDLDMDGAVDIAFTSSDSDGNHYAYVFLNDINSPGSFFLSDEYALLGEKRGWPESIALGDLNDDGYSDITTENGSAIFILFQDSTQPGQFFGPLRIYVGESTESLAIGDLNEDGFNDLAISGFGPHLSILFQDSLNPGNFLPLVNLGITSSSVAIGDLNGDFINDMAVTVLVSGKVKLLFQDPVVPGNFSVAMDLNVGTKPGDVKIGDLDKDGSLDLVVGNFGTTALFDGSISILLQDSANPGEFLHADNYNFSCDVSEISIGDLNDDGFLDIAVASSCKDGGIPILFQDISSIGTFFPATRHPGAYDPWSVVIGDMNKNNFNDLIVSDDIVVIRWQDPAAPGTFLERTVVFNPN